MGTPKLKGGFQIRFEFVEKKLKASRFGVERRMGWWRKVEGIICDRFNDHINLAHNLS